jgi:Domain of unknown function (DUF4157)
VPLSPLPRRGADRVRRSGRLRNRRLRGSGLLPGGRVRRGVKEQLARTRGSGLPLAATARQRFAASLGDAFSDVRVHADRTAHALARSVSARAFTVGSDLDFARGEYLPCSTTGDPLIAHELVHVLQQRGSSPHLPLAVSRSRSHEREAEHAAERASGSVGYGRASIHLTRAPYALQRQEPSLREEQLRRAEMQALSPVRAREARLSIRPPCRSLHPDRAGRGIDRHGCLDN